MGLPPKQINLVKISFQNMPDVASIDMEVTEIYSSTLNKKRSPCSQSIDFKNCSIKYFKAFFNETIKCTLPGNI